MPATHQHRIFAAPIGTATRNTIYTQQGAKPACQQRIHTKFSQLLLAQLPGTQFTHSKAPNPRASNTSAQNFRSSYWHSYPQHHLHTARRQTRMPATHQHRIFAAPIGTATRNTIYTQQGSKPACQQPNNIYTQHGPKPACQQHIHTKFLQLLLAQLPRTQFTQQGSKPACQQHIHATFSQLLLAQLPRTQFTRSKAPNPHASNASTQDFRSSYWHSYPEHNLHTARLQTRMPATRPHKIFAAPIGTATPNTIYTQQGSKPACQQRIHAKFSQLLLAQLPRTQFTHSKAPNPHASNTSTHNFRSSYWHSYPEHNLHTARLQTRMPATHPHKIFAAPIGAATPNTIYTQQGSKPACQQRIHTKFSQLLLAQLPRTQFTHSKAPNPHASNASTQNFCIPIGAATPNTIYTQQGSKPACQQRIHTKFSHLLLAQLPRTQFTHSKAPNPNASNTSAHNFRSSYWRSYPEHNLHTARRQTRMPATHQHRIFAAPIGAATPNTIYTQQGAKPPWQEHINTKFSQLLWNSDPKHNLHTARRQTRMPATHPHKIFAPPIGTATPNTIYTQQGAKPECQQHISAEFSQLLLAQLPGTQFTHSKAPNPHASNAPTQNFRSSYWRSYPERNLHTARRQTSMAGTHQHKIFAIPLGTATPNTIYTQQGAKPACQEDINTKFSQLLLAQTRPPKTSPKRTSDPCRCSKSHACRAKVQRPTRRPAHTKKRTSDPVQVQQVPRLPRKSPAASAAARAHQSVHQTPCRCSKSHACHAKVQRPARTPDPVQMQQVPRLPRKSSGQRGGPHTPKCTSQTPCRCSKSHACHAKVQRPARRPARTKAYIRPRAVAASPTPATQKSSKSHACHAKVQRPARRPAHSKAYIRPRADAVSPRPATQKSSGQRGGPRTPKRTSDPVQMQQVPRLPRKSPAASAAARAHQSVHQTPCRCSKSHACHAKVQRPARQPARTKAYIRPRADAASPAPATQKSSKSHACHAKVQRPARRPAHTKAYIRPRADAANPMPATQKSSGQRGGPRTPKRTSDPVQMQYVPRLPRKSPAASAAARAHQSVHQTPCRCSKSRACHAKVQRPARRRDNDAKTYIGPPADAPSPTPATQKQRQSRGDQTTPKRTSDPLQCRQVPRLPRKSSGKAAETKRRQNVHRTPCRCTKSHACDAKAATEPRRPNNAKAYIRPPAVPPSPTPATQKQRQSGGAPAMSSCVMSSSMSSRVISGCVMCDV